MRRTVTTNQQSYPVIIQTGSSERFNFSTPAVVVCDRQVQRSYPKLLPQYRRVILPDGEANKRLRTIEWLCLRLLKLGCDRSTSLIGIGGGVVGDMVGFTAAVFMRGVPYYHVPTTLLAMVDSSIGGKTGVDLSLGKNLIGTTYQPMAVISDPRFLLTLSAEQFSNGLAEVIKHAVLEPSLLSWIEQHRSQIQRRHLPTLQQLISRNVEIKAAIVAADEHETLQRMLLNLGHTFGHAFEKLSRYTIPHGQAVAIGLMYAMSYTAMPQHQRVAKLLQQFDLPIRLPRPYSPRAIVQAMHHDKKHRGNYITLVVPLQLGHVRIDQTVTPAHLLRFLQHYHG
ncbi:MAG: 3-dehydroquinate synthase [Candidatus Kerfeldbacteria bacterium]|nr:3-dehydroquinate synthase [Candidatus Kerfeldbacteria bacterium]